MASVTFCSVRKGFAGATLALHQLSLGVKDKEFIVLVGSPRSCAVPRVAEAD